MYFESKKCHYYEHYYYGGQVWNVSNTYSWRKKWVSNFRTQEGEERGNKFKVFKEHNSLGASPDTPAVYALQTLGSPYDREDQR